MFIEAFGNVWRCLGVNMWSGVTYIARPICDHMHCSDHILTPGDPRHPNVAKFFNKHSVALADALVRMWMLGMTLGLLACSSCDVSQTQLWAGSLRVHQKPCFRILEQSRGSQTCKYPGYGLFWAFDVDCDYFGGVW